MQAMGNGTFSINFINIFHSTDMSWSVKSEETTLRVTCEFYLSMLNEDDKRNYLLSNICVCYEQPNWLMHLHLPVQSTLITTKVVRSNHAH
jgi:hypothetical protein